MSSVNPHYTFNYSQPDEYRFSHDSVFLARLVFEALKGTSLKDFTVLDLCSGCGIIGLDFLYHCKMAKIPYPQQFDFLEVQNLYREHFLKNLSHLGEPLPATEFINQNYDILKEPASHGRYDLILSNPPYFRTGQGKLSPSDFKNRCRFFIDSDFKKLIEAIDLSLKPEGRAYILLRDLKDHGWNPLTEAQKILSPSREVSPVAEIRGTPVILIS